MPDTKTTIVTLTPSKQGEETLNQIREGIALLIEGLARIDEANRSLNDNSAIGEINERAAGPTDEPEASQTPEVTEASVRQKLLVAIDTLADNVVDDSTYTTPIGRLVDAYNDLGRFYS